MPHDDEVTITLKDGQEITMTRNDETGGMTICTEDACLTLPATASEFLAAVELFQSLEAL